MAGRTRSPPGARRLRCQPRRRRRAVSRAEFAAVSRGMPLLDDRKYREDMDQHVNDDLYDRAYSRGEFAEDIEPELGLFTLPRVNHRG
ncbi:hypothetical protein ABZ260_07425 [Streptosporangium sp. NPDC006013]|uniref:hypothetical protein n=1 Tax=Streptosporangium sp. NPDC006013 TaxID=3155596 RepID=UPI0033B40DA0